jgi:hypothetical protein
MRERRQYRRGRTYLGGRLAFNNQYCMIDCLVRNMSRNGAKLVFQGTVLLPGEFELIRSHCVAPLFRHSQGGSW